MIDSAQKHLEQRLSSGGGLKVTFLTVMPSPYTEDLFQAMRADGRIEPAVYYLEAAAPDTYWEQRELPEHAQVLSGRWFSFLGGRLHVNPGAVRSLRETEADLYVVAGYAGVTNQAVMHWLHASGRPWIFWGETPGMRSGGMLSLFRWLAQRPAVRWPNGIAAIGSRAVAAYRSLAPAACVIENIPYHCQMDAFLKLPLKADGPSDEVPTQEIQFLYCGQLIERKGVDQLVPAFCRLAAKYPQITLKLVGEGPLRATLEQSVPQAVRGRVIFTGFKQMDELTAEFATADVFVLPSRHDGWGVVVNQAIAAGLPVICSEAAGAGVDLVPAEQNGLRFPAGDEAALEKALEHFAAQPTLCQSQGLRSREIAIDYTPQRGVDRWWSLCLSVLKKNRLLTADFPTHCESPTESSIQNA